MSIRTILVPLAGSNDIGPVVELGLTMGTDLGAHVEVLHILSDPKDTIPLLGEGMSVSMIEDMIDAAEKEGGDRAARGQQVFDDLCRQFSVTVGGKPGEAGASASWGQEVGRDDEVTARRGRLADLIVVGHRRRNTIERWWRKSTSKNLLTVAPCSVLVSSLLEDEDA